ncbi:hypothetical protein BJY01DRAFT_248898 [Aspergillus pseudoustus]|uniref:Uncharacterized protein n=1 Tax=Aspergillus pseudoustus TaxID=1810923 RepID=A0ABR4JSZ5_9EURO
MRRPNAICAVIVAIFAVIAIAVGAIVFFYPGILPSHHESDTIESTANTARQVAPAPALLAVDFYAPDTEIDIADFPVNITALNDLDAKEMKREIGCYPGRYPKASKSGIKIGINQLKTHPAETTCPNRKCRWASCTAPGAAIWWCNDSGSEKRTTHRAIASMAEAILDNCHEKKEHGEAVVSGIYTEDDEWRVLVIGDHRIC